MKETIHLEQKNFLSIPDETASMLVGQSLLLFEIYF